MITSVQQRPVTPSSYLDRYAEYFGRCGTWSMMAGGLLWVEHGPAIIPVGPLADVRTIPQVEARAALAKYRKGLLLYYTDGFERADPATKWYAVVCRKPLDLSAVRAKTRSEIRRGLRECTVRKVDAAFIAENGYEVHVRAHARYVEAHGPSMQSQPKDDFQRNLKIARDFSDIIDYWAVFCGQEMVGYAEVQRLGGVEAFYTLIELDPAYFKAHSSYAIVYAMNEHYLREQGFSYVNDGFRSVLHPTNFQEFLAAKFGFEFAPLNLHVVYKPWVAGVMAVPGPIRRLVSRFVPGFAAMNAIHEAALLRKH